MLIGIMLVHCMNCMSSTTTERTTDRKQLDQESQEQRHHQGATYYLHERKN